MDKEPGGVVAELPTVDLLELASRTPVVVTIGGRVYHVTVEPTPTRALGFMGRRYGLIAGGTLQAAEQRYRRLYRAELERGRELQREQSAQLGPAAPGRALSDRAALRAAEQFARSAIVPRLIAMQTPAHRLPPPRRTPLIAPRRTVTNAAVTDHSFLACLKGCLLMAGRAFPLSPVSAQADAPIQLAFGDRHFAPEGESRDLDSVWQWIASGLFGDTCLQAPSAECGHDEPRQPLVFENQIGGVVLEAGNEVIFVHVPAFAVRHVDGETYVFRPGRVALPIMSPGTRLGPGMVRVVGHYEHPFVSQAGTVCMVTAAEYYEELNQMDRADAMLQLLLDARHTLRFGFRRNSAPHRALESFTGNRLPAGTSGAVGMPVFDSREAIEN